MALTEIPAELSSTPGIADSSNATAITIDSSENTTFSVDSNVIVQGTHNEGGGLLFIKGTDTAAADKNLGSLCFGNPSDSCLAMIRGVSTASDSADLRFYTEATSAAIEENMRINSVGNVGIGDTVPAWGSNYRAVTVGSTGSIWASKTGTSGSFISDNSYFNGSNNIARNANAGSEYAQSTGHHVFYTAASVSAGAAQTMTTVLKTDPNGHVTMPLQPAFQVNKSSGQSNFTAGSTITVTWDTERFDVGDNFASNEFTAPVTGKYQFSMSARLLNIDTASNYFQMWFVTSNRSYEVFILHPQFSADVDYYNVSWSMLADMDANDTAKVQVYQSGGTSQVDMGGGTDSHFAGYLVG